MCFVTPSLVQWLHLPRVAEPVVLAGVAFARRDDQLGPPQRSGPHVQHGRLVPRKSHRPFSGRAGDGSDLDAGGDRSGRRCARANLDMVASDISFSIYPFSIFLVISFFL